jgi:hypothetical protein
MGELVIHRGPVGIESEDGMRMPTRDGKLRDDMCTGHHCDCGDLVDTIRLDLMAAIPLDLESPKGAACGTGVEADGAIVEEAWEPDPWIGSALLDIAHARLMRQLASPAGADVEEENLRRLIPGG